MLGGGDESSLDGTARSDIFARHGLTLVRQTLCDWVATAAGVLTPIYDDLKAVVLTSKVIHTDDTVFQMAEAMSVFLKSSPLNRSASPVTLARA